MIGIDIIRKKRSTSGTSGGSVDTGISTSSGGDAQNALHADEADHANRADEATHAASAKEIDGGSSVWNTIRTWISGATDAMKDVFLRKDQDDSTEHKLTMGEAEVKGDATVGGTAKSTDYTHTGFPFGKGWGVLKDDGNGASMFEVDKLFVRMKAYFAELEIRKISYLGGNYVFSSGGGKIYYVEWLDANGKILEQTEANKSLVYTFRCYLYSDDGTTQTMNWFKVDDQVRCQNFGDLSKTAKAANGVITAADYTTHYWWRRVNAVGNGVIAAKGDKKTYQYIDFQNTAGQYGADSDFPEIGDAMVQFGNWTTASRQGVIMIVVTGDDAPAIIEWQDVGANYKHFAMPEKEYTRLSPRGDGNIIRGKFISVSGTTTDNTGKSLDEQINALVDQLNDIKNQADRKFDIWFNGGEPHPNSAEDKATNAPASDWTTDAEKGLHAQDLYYDTDKDPASNGGRAWRWMAHNTDGNVAYYWDKVTDQDTIDALEKAADLQNQVDDIVSDGIISHGSEKSSLLVEWNTACSNYNKYNEQATDYSLRDDDTWKAFSNAFFAVATMLNNGADYTYPNVPAWINSDGITKDTALADTPCHDAAEYRAKWNAYYETLAALLAAITKKAKELADSAQSTADEQKKRIDDIVSDGIISHGSEKSQLLIEWNKAFSNYQKYSALAATYALTGETEWYTYHTSFFNLAVMLNGGQSYTDDNVESGTTPSWLSDDLREDTAVNASTYRSTWKAYNDAFAALLKSLSDKTKGLVDEAQASADKKVQTFVSTPVPPYKNGDFWIQTGNDKKNNVLVCINGREANDKYHSEDWTNLSNLVSSTDVRTILATLADKVYALVWDDYLGKSTIRYVDVYIGSQPSSLVYDYNLSYYNGVLYKRNSSWQEVNGSGFESTFATVMSILGTIKIRVSNYTNTASPKQYDLALTQISIKDPVDGNETMGTCEIEMYNEDGAWEVLRTCTLAIFKNYGDHIVGLVAGSEQTLSGRIDSLSGIYATQDSVNTLSQKFTFDKDGNVVNIKKSGLLTTADGNLLYAMSQNNTVNMLMGTTTGVGWTKETTCAKSDFTFNADKREFKIINYFPKFRAGYEFDETKDSDNSSFATLKSPIVRIVRGQKYIVSFQLSSVDERIISDDKINFNVCLRYGTSTECVVNGDTKYFAWGNKINESDGKREYVIIRSSSNSNRYFVIFEASNNYDYIQVLFINAVARCNSSSDTQRNDVYYDSAWPHSSTSNQIISSDATISEDDTKKITVVISDVYTGSSTQYARETATTTENVTPISMSVSKIQMEPAVRDTIADIEPSEYKESQNAIESYIKQTADSIKLNANNIIIDANHKLSINGDFVNIKTKNFTLDDSGNVSITGIINATGGTFSGKSGYFNFLIDADNHEISMFGPRSFSDSSLTTPGSTTEKFEYISLGKTSGQFISGVSLYAPLVQLKMSFPYTDSSYSYDMSLDAVNGLVFSTPYPSPTSWVRLNMAGLKLYHGVSIWVDYDQYPKKVKGSYIEKGTVYLDGDTLKVKTNDNYF